MTEAEWFACDDPKRMVHFLRGQVSDRKLILFAAACFRSRFMWSRLGKTRRREIYQQERDADILPPQARNGLSEAYDKASLAIDTAAWKACPIGEWTNVPRDEEFVDYIKTRYQKERNHQRRALYCIFGNPLRSPVLEPSCRTENVVQLAQTIYQDKSFDRMPILADALEDAGCTNTEVLKHCRGGDQHFRGCWAIDLFLEKA
jgi:hypothetical protein